jgi:hypothetical protein
MDNFIDRLYKEDIKELAHKLNKEQIEALEAMPVFTYKPEDSSKPFEFIALGVDLAKKPDTAYVGGVFYSEDE